MSRTESPRKHLAVHARKLALEPDLQILRPHRRSLLRRLEQAHRSALADHVHRNARMGPPVLISEPWYYMLDYGGPVGFRMALAHPERVGALIVQDAVAHNEGLGELWKPRRAFWADRAAHESAFRGNFLSLATTRARHAGDDPNPEPYDPDLWTDELAFLGQPGQADIQTELFYDYRTNVDAYPKWQASMRK